MKRILISASIAAMAGGLIYLGVAGRTDSWPKTQCRVVSSRVVRSDVPRGPADSTLVLYSGLFRLEYIVEGQSYYVWADSGWWDKDEKFVRDKTDNLPQQCPYYVQYNPKNPAESVAHTKSN